MKMSNMCRITFAVQAVTNLIGLYVRLVVAVSALLSLPVFSQGITIVNNVKGYLGSDKAKVCTAHNGTTEVSYDATGVSKLVIVIGTESGFNNQSATVTGVKFNNVALTQAVQDNTWGNTSYDGGTVAIFYLDNPYQGAATFTVSATTSAGGLNGGLVSVIGLSGTGPGVGGTGKSWITQAVAGNVATSLTTANFDSLVIAGVENSGNQNISSDPAVVSPLTMIHNGRWSSYGGLASGYQFVSACGTTLTPTFNTAAGGNIHVVAAEFMPPVPTQHWDINGSSTGAGGPSATGTWDGSLANWNPDPVGTNTVAAWSAGSTAVFAAGTDATGTYAVAVDATNDIAGLIFEEGAVTLANGAAGMLRLTGNTPANVAAGRTATIATPISDDGGGRQLVKVGIGALALSGNCSFGGAMGVAQGVAVLSGDNSAATGGMSLSGGLTQFESLASINGTTRNVTLTAPGVMLFGASFGAANISNALDRIVTTSTGVIAADNYDATAFDFNTAGLTAAYLGATGSVTYTGTLKPASGNYRLGGGGGTLTLTVPNTVTGSGSTLAIGGNLNLTVANDHTGGTTLNAGALTLGNADALGSGTFTIAGSGPLQASGTIVTVNPVAANSDFTIGGTGALTLGDLTLNANRVITLNSSALTTFGAISGSNRALTFSGNGSATVTGAITVGTGALTKNGTGTLTLSGSEPSSFTGGTTVNAGSLIIVGTNALSSTSTIWLLNKTLLRIQQDGDFTIANPWRAGPGRSLITTTQVDRATMGSAEGANYLFTGQNSHDTGSTVYWQAGPNITSGTPTVTLSGGMRSQDSNDGTITLYPEGVNLRINGISNTRQRTWTLSGTSTSNEVYGGVADNGASYPCGITKAGSGTWTLSAINTYTRPTAINQGTLIGVTGGSCANSSVTLADAAALGIRVTDINQPWSCSNLTVSAGTAAQLKFSYAQTPSTTLAPLSIMGNLTFTGVPGVDVDPSNIQLGKTLPLLTVTGSAPTAVPVLTGIEGTLSWGGTGNKTLFLTTPAPGTVIRLQ